MQKALPWIYLISGQYICFLKPQQRYRSSADTAVGVCAAFGGCCLVLHCIGGTVGVCTALGAGMVIGSCAVVGFYPNAAAVGARIAAFLHTVGRLVHCRCAFDGSRGAGGHCAAERSPIRGPKPSLRRRGLRAVPRPAHIGENRASHSVRESAESAENLLICANRL